MSNSILLPTAYLAPISYYALLTQYQDCNIEYHEHFIKQSIRNRCEVYGANGKLRLTIPRQRQGSSRTLITDIKISYEEKWQREHWNTIISTYNSSPFFEFYKDKIQPYFLEKETYLINFNNKLQDTILNILQGESSPNSSNKYYHIGDFVDMRNHKFNATDIKRYDQVFMERNSFIPNLSIIDLLFNLGPASGEYLSQIDTKKILDNID